ncbi:hypothetical protein BDP81DRAFT_19442 [Colletotrichum phormii]|uniref:Uncharacterized protein n=1 Tax=Colletotrichum phormii TaxID=359342 RepID=A0AAJ0A4F3_9PEZI|nr:uncharacterized protein BDP81DRAFT_19442 [Colletotrichum phormii]KAK1656301.1 hypothetical protein BDP81DRAFT_19442 [Colletotrichum phormii]
MGDVMIRNLDYANRDEAFNNWDYLSEGYTAPYLVDVCNTAPDLVDGCIVRTHDCGGKKASLCIMALEQQEHFLSFAGKSKSSSDKDDSNIGDHVFELKLSDTALSIPKNRQMLSIKIAYTLLCGESIVPPQVSPKDISEILYSTYESQFITEYPELDFCLRRNLEHILSVCSIPVGDGEPPAIALTCGDIDGHRVGTVASFYAFELLLLAWDHFQRRIREVSTLEHDEKPSRATRLPYIHKMA